jgi:hypothetical protein
VLAGREIRVIEGGHALILERPNEIARIVEEWVSH